MNGRLDFSSVSHNAPIAQQSLNLAFRKSSDMLNLEIGKASRNASRLRRIVSQLKPA